MGFKHTSIYLCGGYSSTTIFLCLIHSLLTFFFRHSCLLGSCRCGRPRYRKWIAPVIQTRTTRQAVEVSSPPTAPWWSSRETRVLHTCSSAPSRRRYWNRQYLLWNCNSKHVFHPFISVCTLTSMLFVYTGHMVVSPEGGSGQQRHPQSGHRVRAAHR